jgi:hypothetical protein
MQDWNAPIRDLPTAQAYFRAMGCSHFHMGRDYPDRYKEYKAVQISEETEVVWMRAEFESTLDALINEGGEADALWAQHSYLAELVA